MTRTLFVIFSGAILLSACHRNRPATGLTVLHPPLQTTEHLLHLSDIADSLSYIKLATDTSNLIGVIDKIIPLKDRILIVDKDITQTIYIFDKSGKFIRKINKKGRGPGEYLSLNDVAVDVSNKRLIVHDDMAQKISIFTYEGEFIEKIRLDFITTSIAYLGNNRLACYCDYINNPNYSIRSKSPNLILFDLQTRKTQSKLFFNSTINRLGITGFINNLSSTYSNDTVHLIMPLNDTVYSICNNKVQPEYYVDLGVTPQMRELQRTASSSKSAQEASQEDSKPQYPVICNMLESDSVVYLFYRHNNKSYYGFYNPRRKTFKEGVRIWEKNTDNRIPVVNDLDKTIPFMPMATDGKNFYYVMESFYFDYFRNSDNPQIANLSKTITANDNPVIVVAHIKNNP
ncbi:Uncharacterised protein [Alistipes sp. cv1]|nr:Uncharacterised protein [Faecalibacterium prausnitzii]